MAKEPISFDGLMQFVRVEATKCAEALYIEDDAESRRIIDASIAEVETTLKKYRISAKDFAVMLLWFATDLERSNGIHQNEELANKRRISANASNAAIAKHAKSGAGTAKNAIRLLWLDWQRKPNKYRSASAFARDMLDKYPDEISNQQTVTRWCREWSAAQSTPDAPKS